MKRITGASFSQEVSELELTNRKIAYEAALEGIVLLENKGALPLKTKRIYAFGPGVKHTIKGGTGSGEVNERYSVNIYDGLKNKGFEILSEKWLEDYSIAFDKAKEAHRQKCKKAMAKAKNAAQMIDVIGDAFKFPFSRLIDDSDISDKDVPAIYVICRQAGEACDKRIENKDVDLYQHEIDDIKFLQSKLKEVIIIINSGSMMDLSSLDDNRPNGIIYFAQQGEEGGNALASILLGEASPSGKLTDTWAVKYSDIPNYDQFSYLSGDTTREEYKEDIYVGYRYFDTFKVEPKYHFGYGLSYTKFNISLSKVNIVKDDISVQIKVKNIGDYAGKEVVQVYAALPKGKLNKEYQRLIGFAKTNLLEKGKEEEVAVSFKLEYLKSYDEDRDYSIIEKGDYIIRIGNASSSLTDGFNLRVEEEIVVEIHDNLCPLKENLERITSDNSYAPNPNLPVYKVNKDAIVTKKNRYNPNQYEGSDRAKEIVDSLKTKELIEVVVGSGYLCSFSKNKVMVPGAVGRLTNNLIDKGILGIQFADGPAGLRLMRRSKVALFWLKMIDAYMEFIDYLPKTIRMLIMANPDSKQQLFQYCTAFPVAISLAQTWNTPLCEKIGKAISQELSKYLVSYWLAPAMNIHRNPLCGRNFEYYSEDPLLAGKIASSLVRGVESVDGNYTTLKHFACNNQEDNRNRSDSILSKRALREIYLRGYEIAVKESNPHAIMTAYNKINGVYSCDNTDLITHILRDEWGFSGIAMTDWNATDPGLASNPEAMAAGNDLIMPGSGFCQKEILKAIKEGKISIEDIKTNARRIVDSMLNSKVYKEHYKELK